MAATPEIFRRAFPAFLDPGTYPNHEVEYWLGLAAKLHNADRWGELLDDGIYLWVAHNLSLEASSKQDVDGGQIPGQIKGAITSASVDKVSYSRDGSAASDPTAGHWNLSTYGLRWVRLARLIGMGPIQVGAGNEAGNFSALAWPGVVPSVWG